ncbi:hypothetical protein [Saccharothrix violaceirubra]|uniref:Uncharacterized protein n=1 Tax=Saccharothrix violaceirubra TaxID=413306 RepID=A0A7W7T4U8_9PSEU|nr:hypothetical protein [Saccharothrix violaceirubra]MBB4966562.1 hypothetical protein [Saccharothrix violaceirubra]
MLALVAALALTVIITGVLLRLPDRKTAERVPTLDGVLGDFVAALSEDAPYRPPPASDRERFADALSRLDDGVLRDLGARVDRAVDQATGRPYALVDARMWGLYVVDLSAPVRLAVQVPHPANDLRTDGLGLDLFRRVPGAVLSVAGTHRRAGDGAGDVAHRTDSVFHAVAAEHTGRGLAQVQVHGFDDASLPDVDVVLSPGAARDGDHLKGVADRLDEDLEVCRAWSRDCDDLEGRTNVQGEEAAEHGVPFAHVELSRSVRESASSRRQVVDALAEWR